MDLAVGNIYGSVLVQITLVLGIVVAFKPLKSTGVVAKRWPLMLMSGVPTALLWERVYKS